MRDIKFGTSGFRGIINKDFNQENIKKIALATARFLIENNKDPRLVIGYDPREGNDPKRGEKTFTKTLCETLINAGINVVFFNHYAPTPFVSWYVKEHKCQGALILTASHNPPEYNGIKFNDENGAPSSISITGKIEQFINEYDVTKNFLYRQKKAELTVIAPPWSVFCLSLKNELKKIKLTLPDKLSMKIIIDCKHGTAAPLWEALSHTFQIKNLVLLHKAPCKNFNFIDTNPCNTQNLIKLKEEIINHKAILGVANDPDADRHIILDEKGIPLNPEETALIIMDFLKNKGIICHSLISTLASSGILKSASTIENFAYQECCVGFKFIAAELLKYQNKKELALGIESSGGFSSSFHTLEKCGFLPGILIMLALSQNKKLSELKKNILKKYGAYSFQESSCTFNPIIKNELQDIFKKILKHQLQSNYSLTISHCDNRDGLKILFTNKAWTLLRFSGTEALIRIYSESKSNEEALLLIEKSKNLIKFYCKNIANKKIKQ